MFRLIPAFASTVFLSLNYGVLLYVHSTFLKNFFSEEMVSLIFLLVAIVNASLFLLAPKLLNRFGNRKLLFIFTLISALSAFALPFVASGLEAALAFIIYECFIFMIYYSLDIIVEEKSENQHTGEIRGIYYTIINSGIAAGPLLMAFFVESEDLRKLYLNGAYLLLIPLVFSIWMLFLKNGHLPRPAHSPLNLPWKAWWQKRNVRAGTLSRLALETFYGVMVIYTPIYLHQRLGFEWGELGVIFAVMLLPFVFLEYPAGELADRKWGEKEMMSVGFFLMGMALLSMPFLGKVFAAWMLVLFVSRVGAALVEIMTETYFFKKISASDTGMLAIFRLTRPLGILFGAAIGAGTLAIFSMEKIFIVLAFAIFFGMKETLSLKDTL